MDNYFCSSVNFWYYSYFLGAKYRPCLPRIRRGGQNWKQLLQRNFLVKTPANVQTSRITTPCDRRPRPTKWRNIARGSRNSRQNSTLQHRKLVILITPRTQRLNLKIDSVQHNRCRCCYSHRFHLVPDCVPPKINRKQPRFEEHARADGYFRTTCSSRVQRSLCRVAN